MKVLSIGSDRKVFEVGSAVSLRNISYGSEMEELHIVVFSLSSNNLKEIKLSDKVTVYPTNSFSRLLYIYDAIKIGKRIIKERKFVRGNSVITCQDPFESGWVGFKIAHKFNLPLHLQIHTDFLSPYFKSSILQRVRVAMAKYLLPKASYVRVVSNRISDSIKKEGINLKNTPRLLPVFVDVSEIESKKISTNLNQMFPKFRFIILLASRLTKEKNIGNILEVFSRVLRVYSHVGLVIAGEGPLRNKLEKKACRLEISKNVVFLGWRNDVSSLMKSADMFLSASAYEGYGMSIIEAGLLKCPVLSTDVGIAGDILVHNKNSYICPINDNICLYDGITAFIGDNALRYSLAQALLQDLTSSIPSKDDYIKKYIELLEEASKS